MSTNKELDNIDVQFLFNLSTLVNNYVGEMIKQASINKCDVIQEIINSIIIDSLDKEKVISKLMITKTAEDINKNVYEEK